MIKAGSLITADDLRRMGACSSQIVKFRAEWPNGVKIRLKNLRRAADISLPVRWFGKEILDYYEREKFNELYFSYERGPTFGHDAAWALWQVLKERK